MHNSDLVIRTLTLEQDQAAVDVHVLAHGFFRAHPYNMAAVAVLDPMTDTWRAYMAGIPDHAHTADDYLPLVVRGGFKLPEHAARGLFSQFSPELPYA